MFVSLQKDAERGHVVTKPDCTHSSGQGHSQGGDMGVRTPTTLLAQIFLLIFTKIITK